MCVDGQAKGTPCPPGVERKQEQEEGARRSNTGSEERGGTHHRLEESPVWEKGD